MRYIIILILGMISMGQSFAQGNTIKPYAYGKNGMEYIVRYQSGHTVIVSTFHARADLVEPISKAMFQYFTQNKPISGAWITLEVEGAKVSGSCIIKEIDRLTSVEFHYDTVVRSNGITEVYRPVRPELPTSTAQSAIAIEE